MTSEFPQIRPTHRWQPSQPAGNRMQRFVGPHEPLSRLSRPAFSRLEGSLKALLSRYALLLAMILMSPGNGWSAEPDAPLIPANLSPSQAMLSKGIKSDVMAPCCWHGTVDSHNSPIANKIANQIDHMVEEGKTRDQILDSISKEYGERIIASPRTNGNGVLYYAIPAMVVLASGFGLYRWVKRTTRTGVAAAATSSAPEPKAPAPNANAYSDAVNQQFEEQLKRFS